MREDDISYSDYKKSFAYIAQFFGLPKEEIIIEWLEIQKSKNPNEPDRIALRYSKGLHKIKIPKDIQLIHVSPVDNIKELQPAFRSKIKGKFMYPTKRCFFTVGKAINPFKMGTADTLWTPSKVKLHKYVTSSDIGEAYIDPTYTNLSDGSVMILTDKSIPVMKFEDKMNKIFKNIIPKKKEDDKNKKPVNEEVEIIGESFKDFLKKLGNKFSKSVDRYNSEYYKQHPDKDPDNIRKQYKEKQEKINKTKREKEIESWNITNEERKTFSELRKELSNIVEKEAKSLHIWEYIDIYKDDSIEESYSKYSDIFDIGSVELDSSKLEKLETEETMNQWNKIIKDFDSMQNKILQELKKIYNKVETDKFDGILFFSMSRIKTNSVNETIITLDYLDKVTQKMKEADPEGYQTKLNNLSNHTLDDELFDDSIFEEDTSWYDQEIAELVESVEFNEEVLVEGSVKEFLQTIKNWKTSNESHSQNVFKSSTLSDEEYEQVKSYLDIMKKEDVKYKEYKTAFNKFCAFCHIVPTGTIITKYNLKKGSNGNDNSIEVQYSENTKKIQLPEGIKLFHISKVPNISKLIPQFKGKSERGYLYDKPRVYFTINKYMPKFLADYKATDKLYKYECKKDIKDVYVDPLVWNVSQGAVYVETDSDIPVEEIKMTDDIKDTTKKVIDTVNPLKKDDK